MLLFHTPGILKCFFISLSFRSHNCSSFFIFSLPLSYQFSRYVRFLFPHCFSWFTVISMKPFLCYSFFISFFLFSSLFINTLCLLSGLYFFPFSFMFTSYISCFIILTSFSFLSLSPFVMYLPYISAFHLIPVG